MGTGEINDVNGVGEDSSGKARELFTPCKKVTRMKVFVVACRESTIASVCRDITSFREVKSRNTPTRACFTPTLLAWPLLLIPADSLFFCFFYSRSAANRSACSNIADNPIHETLPDKLVGTKTVAETRLAKYVAVSLLTRDLLDTSAVRIRSLYLENIVCRVFFRPTTEWMDTRRSAKSAANRGFLCRLISRS